jgi:hypothetical protein
VQGHPFIHQDIVMLTLNLSQGQGEAEAYFLLSPIGSRRTKQIQGSFVAPLLRMTTISSVQVVRSLATPSSTIHRAGNNLISKNSNRACPERNERSAQEWIWAE